MAITSKYPGKCSACGGSIPAGTQVEWNKATKMVRHVKCPGTVVRSKQPLNSPGRAALQGRGRSDFFLGEKSPIERGWTMDAKPGQETLGQTILATKGDEAGQYLTCIGLAAHYVSQDEADDFDLTHRGSFGRHWSVTKYYRLATPEEAEACAARRLVQERAKRLAELCDFAGKGITAEAYEAAKAGATVIWANTVGYSRHQAMRTEAGLLGYHPVYDDSPRLLLLRWDDMSPEDAALIREAPELLCNRGR